MVNVNIGIDYNVCVWLFQCLAQTLCVMETAQFLSHVFAREVCAHQIRQVAFLHGTQVSDHSNRNALIWTSKRDLL